jgi:uncharacterized protein YheU (UPF0270 family)
LIKVPYEQIPEATLRALVEAYISREGTDYGLVEIDFATKVEQVLKQIRALELVLTWDNATESCNILTRQQAVEYDVE